MTAAEKKVAFFHQSVDKRMAIVAAGPAFNYFFAIIILAFLFMFHGQPYTAPDVNDVVKGSIAAKAGIKVGDHIVSIDNYAVDRFEDVKRIVALNAGTPIPIEVERKGKRHHYTLTPEIVTTKDRFGGEHKVGRIGIVSTKIDYIQQPPLKAVGQAFLETWNLTAGTLQAIGQMVIGERGTEELGGPLRIAEMSGNVAKDGAVTLIWFMAVISINLGLINLFPVPLLDGGHLIFYIAERLRGKPVGEKVMAVGNQIGLVLVLSLMVFATWNDLVHLRVISYLRGLFS
jgi:regulator of sigma E protease